MYELIDLPNGAKALRAGSLTLAFGIPSRKRENIVVANPFLEVANLYVHADEVESYQEYLAQKRRPAAAIRPHTQPYLPHIRNFMLDELFVDGVDAVVQCDDDTTTIKWMGGRIEYVISDLEGMLAVVWSTALTAKELGAGAFGYHQSGKPTERKATKPFFLRGWISAQLMGVSQRDLRFDEHALSHNDMDFCLTALQMHHIVFRDDRYFVNFHGGKHGVLPGGLANTRSSEREQVMFKYLEEKWGSEIIQPGRRRGAGITIKVAIPQ